MDPRLDAGAQQRRAIGALTQHYFRQYRASGVDVAQRRSAYRQEDDTGNASIEKSTSRHRQTSARGGADLRLPRRLMSCRSSRLL
jgi:hypothetical protein